MPLLQTALHHPRRLFLRRAAFQIHLWAGLLLTLYLVVISLSGSILVFRDELTRTTLPRALRPWPAGRSATSPEIQAVLSAFHAAHPDVALSSLQLPYTVLPAFLLEGHDPSGKPARWFADPVTGISRPAPRTWIDWLRDLHYYLLFPTGWGMQLNAAGAAGLLLLAATGLMLWWPGIRTWRSGLRVDLRAGWRRIHYDLHRAVGFWTLLIVLWWAVSGVYFGFYKQFTAAVALVSPIRGMLSPRAAPLPPPPPGPPATLADILAAAQRASPGARLWSIGDPGLHSKDLYITLDRAAPGDFSHRDIVHLRTADAQVTSIWHYGQRETLGDWVLWSMHPLHFGTTWGLGFKLLWAFFGLALASLTVTGTVMYWNRYLRHRLRSWQQAG